MFYIAVGRDTISKGREIKNKTIKTNLYYSFLKKHIMKALFTFYVKTLAYIFVTFTLGITPMLLLTSFIVLLTDVTYTIICTHPLFWIVNIICIIGTIIYMDKKV